MRRAPDDRTVFNDEGLERAHETTDANFPCWRWPTRAFTVVASLITRSRTPTDVLGRAAVLAVPTTEDSSS